MNELHGENQSERKRGMDRERQRKTDREKKDLRTVSGKIVKDNDCYPLIMT